MRTSRLFNDASTALKNNKPSGEILWTIGPATNRRMNINAEVLIAPSPEVAGL